MSAVLTLTKHQDICCKKYILYIYSNLEAGSLKISVDMADIKNRDKTRITRIKVPEPVM